ncbi:conserved hypothetical protein [Arthrobacter sp. Hiyo1]|nr:conserved hypothetical protein [Arthrobacter sp. Hiyo1]
MLAFREHGAVTGGGEEPANTRARGPDTLGEVPLRDEFQFDFAGLVLGVEVPGIRLAREGADHLPDPPFLDQQCKALVALAGVVVHHGEVGGAGIEQRVDEFERLARIAEAPDHDG